MKYKILIELLSDMCPSSGEAYNSSVDTEIDYDSYGIPYLSAKRIKGCMRENAQMLADWGEKLPIGRIFGNEGFQKGNLRLSSAKIEQYESVRKEIEAHKDSPLVHPQNVLGMFTYLRTQTAMENGVAKEGSLRILRVLKKGLKFEAIAEFDTSYKNDMENICKVTRNMGLNRTRGLGEIRITWEDITENDKPKPPEGIEKITPEELEPDKEYRLHYRLRFLEPVILKSPDKGQGKTQDYIEGSKMLGVLAGCFGNDAYRELTEEKRICCSNLYVTDSAERYLPAPMSMRTLKDENENVYDLAAGYQTDEQTQGVGNVYVNVEGDKLNVMTVKTQIRYHHSRPEDKSIGRARKDGEGECYQLSSILEGQMFAGFIQGTGAQMEKIKEQMETMRFIRLGYGSASEYGSAELTIEDIKEVKPVSGQACSEFQVSLSAPLLIYDNVGMYTQDIDVLREEIERRLGKPLVVDMEHIYLKYTTVGGWQRMWNKPKQTVYALDKGTVLLMRTQTQEPVCIPEQSVFIGERTAEGYGEVRICAVPKMIKRQMVVIDGKSEPEKPGEEEAPVTEVFICQLEKKQEVIEIKKMGRKAGQDFVKKYNKSCSATVNKLLLTLKEQKTEEGFCEVCKSIKTKEKADMAECIVKKFADFPNYKHMNREEVFNIYTKALLTEAKYLVREKKEKKGVTADE